MPPSVELVDGSGPPDVAGDASDWLVPGPLVPGPVLDRVEAEGFGYVILPPELLEAEPPEVPGSVTLAVLVP
jgi:hypothetical protein